jgi:hypothetical protein
MTAIGHGEDVGVSEVEVIAGTVEVCGHGGKVLCSILAVVAPAFGKEQLRKVAPSWPVTPVISAVFNY